MHTFYISALAFLAGLHSVLAAPVEAPSNTTIERRIDYSKLIDGSGKSCSEFGYMSMGQLEAYNKVSDDVKIRWDYACEFVITTFTFAMLD